MRLRPKSPGATWSARAWRWAHSGSCHTRNKPAELGLRLRAIADLLQVVAEPHRRDILRLIWSRELHVGEIARHFDVTQGSISQHLAILRQAGLVSRRSEGNRRFYRADQNAVGDLRPFLERMWASSIDRLSAAMAADQLGAETDVPN